MHPDDAGDALAAARSMRRRGRRAAVEQPMRLSLVYWGLAWILLYTLGSKVPAGLSAALLLVLLAVPIVWCRVRARRSAIRLVTGWESTLWRAWAALVLGSVAFGLIARPTSSGVVGMLVGALWGIAFALWGIAFALYGILLDDWEVGALGAVIVGLAVLLGVTLADRADLSAALFGSLAGAIMAALGIIRLVRYAREVGS